MRVQLIKLLGKNKQSFMKALGAIKRSMAYILILWFKTKC